MAWANSKPTVDDSPEVIIQSGSGIHIDAPVQVSIISEGPDTCYLGPPGVTVATGYPLALDDQFSCEVRPGNTLVALCDTGDTAVLRILKDGAAS